MELYDVRRTKFIQAHSSGLAALSLSLNGRLLATASDRGTLLRIYSTADGSKLQVKCMDAHPSGSAVPGRHGQCGFMLAFRSSQSYISEGAGFYSRHHCLDCTSC